MSVTVRLEDEIDLSRGDMLVSPENGPVVAKRFRAMVVWLHETPLEVGRTYLVKHTARLTKIRALEIRHRVNVNTLEHEKATQLNMNDIASVEFEAHVPLFFDPYSTNRVTGSFILIDALSNATVGAGMIQEDLSDRPEQKALKASFARDRSGSRPCRGALRTPRALSRHVLARESACSGFAAGARTFRARISGVASRGDEASPHTILEAIRTTQSLGAISIYSGDALDTETKHRLADQANPRLFDLSSKNENADR